MKLMKKIDRFGAEQAVYCLQKCESNLKDVETDD